MGFDNVTVKVTQNFLMLYAGLWQYIGNCPLQYNRVSVIETCRNRG